LNELARKKRIEYLDLAKFIAIFCVVLCHCVEQVYYNDMNSYIDFPVYSKIFSAVCFVIGRCGVPFFLFTTGILIINKRIDTWNDYKKFLKNNFLKILFASEIWIIIYSIFLSIIGIQKFDFIYMLKCMFFIKTIPLMNVWYMPMIIGVYLVLPIISKAIRDFDSDKVLIIVGILSIFVNMLVPTINVIFTGLQMKTIWVYINVAFLGGFVGIYIMSGYLQNKGALSALSNLILIAISVISFIICVLIQLFVCEKNIGYIAYECIFLYVLTICLFEIFKRIKFAKIHIEIRDRIKNISKYSLAIYFIHIIFVMLLGKYIILLEISGVMKITLLYIFTIIASFVLAWGISKIDFAKKMILHIN